MPEHSREPGEVTILSSRLGFGQYIPSLLLKNRLIKAGIPATLLFVEDYFTEEKRATFDKTRKAFNGNPHLARVAAKLDFNNTHLFSPVARQQLIDQWQLEARREFICFSGYWADILEGYATVMPIVVTGIIMDAKASPVWQPIMHTKKYPRELYRFFDVEKTEINYTLQLTADLPEIAWQKRTRQVIAHGGGWGVFEPAEIAAIPDLYQKICIINTTSAAASGNIHYYLNVMPEAETAVFPGLKKIHTENLLYCNNYHVSLELMADARAIISKPGGMTLVDSLITATPVIFLEGIGVHESANQSLWISMGLGMKWTTWKAQGFPLAALTTMHENLVAVNQHKKDLFCQLIAQYKQNLIDHLNP
ncbi:hypothetical protein [Chitinophaga nivalis]|uniref:UDP-glucuronosyltransferase n=1 Tax=Chitinophaga nivalis TaxID=2991709 RepID=A0ABT3ILZ4_9BACT|nr:hypothetical protein [Chitinophaga nivalis]MCW3465316.1 hypothetical protein [Chitinophaga nivalis]MCW3484992.1 hypothetical protein [Chitinophaga nivalis]